MIYQCVNCGANMIFDPDSNAMICESCGGKDCHQKREAASLVTCTTCGGELVVEQFDSTTQCPYCSNYLVLDERVSGQYEPKRILPFKIGKKAAVTSMDTAFSHCLFKPRTFLTEKTLKKDGVKGLKGIYVPFFLYDYKAKGVLVGEGTKKKSWSSGNYTYTETSYYKIDRRLQADFDNIPVDASIKMPDATMDLMEPYEYEKLEAFDPKYMSGFFGEIYNDTADKFEERAKNKAKDSMTALLQGSVSGYSSVSFSENTVDLKKGGETEFVLFPVWKYSYEYGGKLYDYYINGQNGKVIGETPVSKGKVFWYGLTCSALWVVLLNAIMLILKTWGI